LFLSSLKVVKRKGREIKKKSWRFQILCRICSCFPSKIHCHYFLTSSRRLSENRVVC